MEEHPDEVRPERHCPRDGPNPHIYSYISLPSLSSSTSTGTDTIPESANAPPKREGKEDAPRLDATQIMIRELPIIIVDWEDIHLTLEGVMEVTGHPLPGF